MLVPHAVANAAARFSALHPPVGALSRARSGLRVALWVILAEALLVAPVLVLVAAAVLVGKLM